MLNEKHSFNIYNSTFTINKCTRLSEKLSQLSLFNIRALGSLVLLGFDITAFTPVAYLRHRL